MTIALTDFERTDAFSGDYAQALASLQDRLARLQRAQILHGRQTIILFEGWEGAGKKAALRAMCGALDPCHFSVHCTGAVEPPSGRHRLAPYWACLPRSGETSVFFGSWYRQPVESRARDECGDKEWARTFDEINEFEAQQTDHGTLIVKLFFHVPAEVQARRLRARGEDPWLRPSVTAEGLRSLAAREAYVAAWQDMFARSNTRWAGWSVVGGGDERSAVVAAIEAVAVALEKALPAEPPMLEENVVPMRSMPDLRGAAVR